MISSSALNSPFSAVLTLIAVNTYSLENSRRDLQIPDSSHVLNFQNKSNNLKQFRNSSALILSNLTKLLRKFKFMKIFVFFSRACEFNLNGSINFQVETSDVIGGQRALRR